MLFLGTSTEYEIRIAMLHANASTSAVTTTLTNTNTALMRKVNRAFQFVVVFLIGIFGIRL